MNLESKTNLTVSDLEPGIAMITMDMPGTGANILSTEMFDELDSVMAELSERKDLEGLILKSAKPKIFVAGADLNLIVSHLDWPDKDIIRFCDRGRAVMARFSRCPFVTIAAIHGACVGGGLELTLWCDCRIATDARSTLLGLPEVKLGLVPGWAGTARLPRIAGFENAARLVTSGRLISASEAHSMGFVDQVVDEENLLVSAIEMARRVRTSESFIRDRKSIMGAVADISDLEPCVDALGQEIVGNLEIYPYAPTVVLEHMSRTASLPQQEAWRSESIAMSQVWGSPASRGLLNHFFLVDRNKKQPGLVDLSIAPTEITTVGIVGAGLMGSSIAQTCLSRGFNVLILDANHEAARSVEAQLSSASSKSTITAITDYQGFADADLVIESVVETYDVKKIVLQQIEDALPASTVIATNTSAIPIEKLSSFIRHPERFCGIHFCHPELMSLVEVICGPQTSEPTMTTAATWVRKLRKMAVGMNDCAGFVVNRMLAAMLDQSFRTLTDCGVTIEQIDESMRDFGFRGGPFEIIDVIGADTCMYAGRTMWEAGLRCVTLSPILPKMVKTGQLGRKAGVGFYNYPDPRGDRQPNPEIGELLKSYIKDDDATQHQAMQLTKEPEKISLQILSVMLLEATRILDEEIVGDFRDIDLCVIHGFSFPQHRGGIFFWADQIGLETINRTLYEIAEHASHLEPTELLKEMRSRKEKFYQA